MNNKKQRLEILRKFLLNRVTCTAYIAEQIENYVTTDDEAVHHTFHKVMVSVKIGYVHVLWREPAESEDTQMAFAYYRAEIYKTVHNWNSNQVELFEVMSDYYSSSFIPVNCVTLGDVTTFHTSSLSLICRILKQDFMFPHARNMYNVDVLFNDKSSSDCFENHIKIEDIVAGVVSARFNGKMELDLSNFCEDHEFQQKKLHFYKLNLLSNFKILMLRMGRDAQILNLSDNNLSQVPVEILNFFIKGRLIAVNLSNNKIKSITELHRVSSKIEKLWVEGNPFCDDLEPIAFLKQILLKFPRLTELDGIRVNEHGMVIPFFKNFLVTPDKKTQMLTEKFLTLYFTNYDSVPRHSINMFYDANATLSMSCLLSDAEEKSLPHYAKKCRNILPLSKRRLFPDRLYKGRNNLTDVLSYFPPSEHDPTTFTVDLIRHDSKCLVVIVDGNFRERNDSSQYKTLRFRRTFVISVHVGHSNTTEYMITNELFHISPATQEQIEHCFKTARATNPLALCNPQPEEMESLCNVFSHITHLKPYDAELRLKIFGWDIIKALNSFTHDVKAHKISNEKFMEEEDNFSDLSSILDDDDEID